MKKKQIDKSKHYFLEQQIIVDEINKLKEC